MDGSVLPFGGSVQRRPPSAGGATPGAAPAAPGAAELEVPVGEQPPNGAHPAHQQHPQGSHLHRHGHGHSHGPMGRSAVEIGAADVGWRAALPHHDDDDYDPLGIGGFVQLPAASADSVPAALRAGAGSGESGSASGAEAGAGADGPAGERGEVDGLVGLEEVDGFGMVPEAAPGAAARAAAGAEGETPGVLRRQQKQEQQQGAASGGAGGEEAGGWWGADGSGSGWASGVGTGPGTGGGRSSGGSGSVARRQWGSNRELLRGTGGGSWGGGGSVHGSHQHHQQGQRQEAAVTFQQGREGALHGSAAAAADAFEGGVRGGEYVEVDRAEVQQQDPSYIGPELYDAYLAYGGVVPPQPPPPLLPVVTPPGLLHGSATAAGALPADEASYMYYSSAEYNGGSTSAYDMPYDFELMPGDVPPPPPPLEQPPLEQPPYALDGADGAGAQAPAQQTSEAASSPTAHQGGLRKDAYSGASGHNSMEASTSSQRPYGRAGAGYCMASSYTGVPGNGTAPSEAEELCGRVSYSHSLLNSYYESGSVRGELGRSIGGEEREEEEQGGAWRGGLRGAEAGDGKGGSAMGVASVGGGPGGSEEGRNAGGSGNNSSSNSSSRLLWSSKAGSSLLAWGPPSSGPGV